MYLISCDNLDKSYMMLFEKQIWLSHQKLMVLLIIALNNLLLTSTNS